MPLVGMIAVNLNTMIRGESKAKVSVGIKTFVLASVAFSAQWFVLWATAIYTGGDTNTLAGIEVLALFVIGIFIYSLFQFEHFIGCYYTALVISLVIISCLSVMAFG